MATDFLTFNEGTDHVLSSGLPATSYFLLSTDNIAALSATDTLSGGIGEITGTGYARQSQSLPTPALGDITWAASTWNTGSATDWPSTVRSIVLATTVDNSGVAICAWNLIPGGGARNLSTASTTESVTPTLTTESVDVSFASTVALLERTAQQTLTGSTPTIVLFNSVLEDVGSNVVNNGTYQIYHVPSTGVYEVSCMIATHITATAIINYGFLVGSSSAGSAGFTSPNEWTSNIVFDADTNAFGTLPITQLVALTAGQYINLTVESDFNANFFAVESPTTFGIQRIA